MGLIRTVTVRSSAIWMRMTTAIGRMVALPWYRRTCDVTLRRRPFRATQRVTAPTQTPVGTREHLSVATVSTTIATV
jgi:hypothetical protein